MARLPHNRLAEVQPNERRVVPMLYAHNEYKDNKYILAR